MVLQGPPIGNSKKISSQRNLRVRAILGNTVFMKLHRLSSRQASSSDTKRSNGPASDERSSKLLKGGIVGRLYRATNYKACSRVYKEIQHVCSVAKVVVRALTNDAQYHILVLQKLMPHY